MIIDTNDNNNYNNNDNNNNNSNKDMNDTATIKEINRNFLFFLLTVFCV